MKVSPASSRTISILRWTARMWTLLLVILIVAMFSVSREGGETPITTSEVIELGTLGFSALGLVLAYKWEVLGSTLALLGLAAHIAVYAVSRGNFFGREILVLVFGIPAALFLLASFLDRRAEKVRTA